MRPPYFQVCPECYYCVQNCHGVPALFSGVSRVLLLCPELSRCTRPVFWCVQSVITVSRIVAVYPSRVSYCVFALSSFVPIVGLCPSCFLGRPQCFMVCPDCFLVCLECHAVSRMFFGVSRVSQCVHLAFWCVQNVAVCLFRFLVCAEWCGVSALFSGLCRVSWCVRLVFWCV